MEELSNKPAISTPISPLSEQPQVLIKPPKHHRMLAVGVVFAIVVVLAGLKSYYDYRQNQQLRQSTVVLAPSPSPVVSTPVPVIETKNITVPSDWKSFTNTTVGYTFKYPANLKVKENCGNPPGTLCIVSSDYKVDTKAVPPSEGGVDTEVVGVKGYSLSINVRDPQYPFDADGYCHLGGPMSIWECGGLIVNGEQYAARTMGTLKEDWQATLIQNNNMMVDFTASFDPALIDSSKQLTMQIMSTYKVKLVSSMKTYTNAKYGLSFTYSDKKQFYANNCSPGIEKDYPKESTAADYPPGNISKNTELIIDVYPVCGSGVSVSMNIMNNDQGYDPVHYFMATREISCNDNYSQCQSISNVERVHYDVKTFKVDGHEAIRIHPKDTFNEDTGLDMVYIKFGNQMLVFIHDGSKEADQILSTLRFQ